MGAGRERTMIADAARLAEENDKLKTLVGQLQRMCQQLDAKAKQNYNAFAVTSRFLAAILTEAGSTMKMKHRTLSELAEPIYILKDDEATDDTFLTIRLLNNAEADAYLAKQEQAGDGGKNVDAPQSPAGDGDEVHGEEERPSGGGLVDQHGAPLVADGAAE